MGQAWPSPAKTERMRIVLPRFLRKGAAWMVVTRIANSRSSEGKTLVVAQILLLVEVMRVSDEQKE